MRENHMIGITPAHDAPRFDLLRELGVKWVRQGYVFPFEDCVGGALSEAFLRSEAQVEKYLAEGFQVLASFPGPGSMRYAPEAGKTVYVRAMPEWMGEVGSAGYMEALYGAAKWLAERTRGRITYWQVANEPDIDIFCGPLTMEQNIEYLMTVARGLLAGNPDAQPGINLGYINDSARVLMKEMYAVADSPFRYLGIDGYMGSWQLGGPETWVEYIDETARLSGKPIIINEWGFSSLQWGEKYTDLERRNHYNQQVCYYKHWQYTWGKGHTPEEQARYVRLCQQIFAEHPKVIGNFFFRWSDTETCWQCGEADCPAECAWGCVDVNQQPKPAYYALQEGNRVLFSAE